MLFQHALIKVSEIELGPVVRTPASANPGLNFNPAFFFFFFFTKSTLSDNVLYYMAESVSAMRLVNLRFVTCYTDQNFKENADFGALNLFTSEKRMKLSYKTSINLEDLDFDFVLQHFKICLFVNEGDEETNSLVILSKKIQ